MTYPAPQLPHIPASALKPGRGWYVFAVVLAVVLIVAGPVIAAGSFREVLGSAAQHTTSFDAANPFRGPLTGGKRYALYAVTEPGTRKPPPTDCTVTGADGATVPVERPEFEAAVPDADGRTNLTLLSFLTPERAGEYVVDCRPGATSGAGARYAIGDDPQLERLALSLVGGLGTAFGLPCLGLFLGGMFALIAAVRRGNHRKRLQRQAMAALYGHSYGQQQ